ncbi:hypothetical protein O181_079435 [Austropuccinia psidii MF-1]|uniref:Uncharacterized protein n=1 Tax=Austropuccinia psidii MF-1 TaxID=1389203 RepID=A0A9Q3FLE1_9BASI|nr:hypothetical protein [Austropuccinia psidii MF-1]
MEPSVPSSNTNNQVLMTMAPPEIKAFQNLSLLMKDISIGTGHLSKMMTSNYSLKDSTSCCWGKEPTAWKKNHSQGESCSYDSLSLCPTANIQSRSPRTTKDFNLKFFRCTGSQSRGKDQKRIATKKKTEDTSNFIDNSVTNTASEYRSSNNIIKLSSNTTADSL